MRVVRRGDDAQLNLKNRQQLINAAHNARVRIELCCLVAAALDNCGKPQARDSMNHGRVKRAPCQAKSDESNVDHCRQEPPKFAGRAYTNLRAGPKLSGVQLKVASGEWLLQNVLNPCRQPPPRQSQSAPPPAAPAC